MNIKLYNRSRTLRYTMAFLVLSMVFLHVLISISLGESAFNVKKVAEVFTQFKLASVLLIFALYSIFNAKKYSKTIYFFFILSVTSSGLSIFFYEFDKVILFLNVIYMIVAFYFYLCWNEELRDVIFVPGYFNNTLGEKSEYNFPVEIFFGNNPIRGIITNWNEDGLFVYFDNHPKMIRSKVKVQIEAWGKTFYEYGTVVTVYGNGLGIKFDTVSKYKEKNIHGWYDFYDIIADRGYLPRSS